MQVKYLLFLDIVVCFGGRVGEGSLKKKRPASRTTKWTYPEEVVTELTNLMEYKISPGGGRKQIGMTRIEQEN